VISAGRPVDVAIVGGGIIGTSAAALLAEAGMRVLLAERASIGAGASGRNSGSIQHPFDAVLAPFYHRSLQLYAEVGGLATDDPSVHGFRLPAEPTGILLVAHSADAIEGEALAITEVAPELNPVVVAGPELHELEPALAPGVVACRLNTGYAVPPAAATDAFAVRAEQAGAVIELGAHAELWLEERRALGLIVDGQRVAAGSVLVAAGPSSPDVLAGEGPWRPIVPIWGLNVEVALPAPPRHILEELGLEAVGEPAAWSPSVDDEVAGVPSVFSLVTVAQSSTLGSTFLPAEPDATRMAPELRRRGSRFVPSLAEATIRSTRLCARPQSIDGRPLLGPVPGMDNLFVAAGHGPWGISLGPASAEFVVDLILGRRSGVPSEVDPARFGPPGSFD
jgi:glycine/D-amino acid oxidase-like deaminating enzyme